MILFCVKVLLSFSNKKQSILNSTDLIVNWEQTKYHLACPYDYSIYNSDSDHSRRIHATAVIVPHHLLAKKLITNSLESIGNDYQTVILMGPNHRNFGQQPVQASKYNWLTKFGLIKPETHLIDDLLQLDYARDDEETFDTEHSICALVSFIKFYFPQAKLVPLVLKSNFGSQKAEELGKFLFASCPNCLFIASLDFSHEVNSLQADANDQKSSEILINLDESRLNEVIVDSLQSIQVLMSYLKAQKVEKGLLLERSNSAKISGGDGEKVTSYITIVYPSKIIF